MNKRIARLMSTENELTTRREMCRATLRGLALGGLAVVSACLIGKDMAAGDGCQRAPSCQGCAALADCTLPQAMEIKDV